MASSIPGGMQTSLFAWQTTSAGASQRTAATADAPSRIEPRGTISTATANSVENIPATVAVAADMDAAGRPAEPDPIKEARLRDTIVPTFSGLQNLISRLNARPELGPPIDPVDATKFAEAVQSGYFRGEKTEPGAAGSSVDLTS